MPFDPGFVTGKEKMGQLALWTTALIDMSNGQMMRALRLVVIIRKESYSMVCRLL
jgi:hypothetical protein